MKTYFIRYAAGLLFIAFGIYELIERNDIPETLLYVFLGGSFLLMGYLAQHPETPHKKNLNTLSWALIIAAVLAFLYVLTIPGSAN